MTKEEYERLLKSDYWKGYSYSLIKERNFTCEDCGRRFYGERNKLQVHHLVYRDVNPWSYSPDEVVVLCEDCHKKRHGIKSISQKETLDSQTPFGAFDTDYPLNEIDKDPFGEIDNPFAQFDNYDPFGDDDADTLFNDDDLEDTFSTGGKTSYSRSRKSNKTLHANASLSYPIEPEPGRGFKFKYIIYGLLLFLCIMIGRGVFFRQKSITSERPSFENKEITVEGEDAAVSAQSEEVPLEADSPSRLKRDSKPTGNGTTETSADDVLPVEAEPAATAKSTRTASASVEPNDEAVQEAPQRELSTLEILERRNHEEVVRQARRAGVSTEGSTTEILERINHAEVVKQARRAGVSTEGSTTEILERINHAEVVKQARRAGVSTEGSTTEILERINHAEVVKQARRAGVSTEGTTTEILERITRKEMEKYNY